MNMPKVKLGIVAVSRDCFPESLSVTRRENLVKAYSAKYDAEDIYECPVCIVESEIHMVQALEDIKKAGCNALCVYLGNFGPEISETLLAKHFDGPKMFVAAAEETGDDLCQGRGDAYCGMLNASYNLALRNIKAYIPEYPVGDAEDCAEMLHEFLPIARAVIALQDLKIISFGPRPLNFLACNAPIKQLYNLGVEIEENSELDLFEAFNKHAGDERIPAIVKEMEEELGAGNKKPEILTRLAQYELTLKDWIRDHKGYRKYVTIAGKCWPAFQTQFGFVPCYVNSRLTAQGIPVSCEVDIYGALSEFIGTVVSQDAVTLLDINNTVPKDLYEADIKGKYDYTLRQHRIRKTHLLRDEISDDYGKNPSGRSDTGNTRRRHRTWRHYILPPPEHRRQQTARIHCSGRSSSGGNQILRIHWNLRNSGNGKILPPRSHRRQLPAPRRSRIRTLRKRTVRSIQIHRCRR